MDTFYIVVKKYIQIFTIMLVTLQISFLYAEWQLSITAEDEDGIGSNHIITLGTCENCNDSWKYGEDEEDYPNPQTEYTNIHFFHLDWLGTTDINNNVNNDINFASDFRSEHPPDDLISWGIRGSTGNGLSLDIPINLSWDASSVANLSDDYELYIW